MVNRMSAEVPGGRSVMSDRGLRRQIDRSLSRALVDGEYARLLLSTPTVVLEEHGCAPQHYLSLLSIQATTLLDFARQAQALFWTSTVNAQRKELIEAADTVETRDSLLLAS